MQIDNSSTAKKQNAFFDEIITIGVGFMAGG
jgi:hypothetical protein